jgi:hypothetical protein
MYIYNFLDQFLELEMFHTKFVYKTKIYFIFVNIFPIIVPFMRRCVKMCYSQAGLQTTIHKDVYAFLTQ